MTRNEAVQAIKEKFPKAITRLFIKTHKRVYIDIKHESLSEFVTYIFRELDARFNIASAVDTPNAIEILYHFTLDEINLVISMRVSLDRKDPHVKSIAPIMKGAEWIEREIHELFGVEFDGHLNMKPLLLPDGWPKDKYPLRRDCEL